MYMYISMCQSTLTCHTPNAVTVGHCNVSEVKNYINTRGVTRHLSHETGFTRTKQDEICRIIIFFLNDEMYREK